MISGKAVAFSILSVQWKNVKPNKETNSISSYDAGDVCELTVIVLSIIGTIIAFNVTPFNNVRKWFSVRTEIIRC